LSNANIDLTLSLLQYTHTSSSSLEWLTKLCENFLGLKAMAQCLKQRILSPVIFPSSVILRLLTNHSIVVAEKLPRLEHHLKPQQQSLNFLVVGDWGRKGNYNQSLVAHQVIIYPQTPFVIRKLSGYCMLYAWVGLRTPTFHFSTFKMCEF